MIITTKLTLKEEIKIKRNICIKVLAILLILQCVSLPAGAAVYTYDELNRLTSVIYDFGQEMTYTYDAGGNLLTVEMQGDTTSPAVISTDPANGSSEVPADKIITVTFNESVAQGVYSDGIIVKNTVDKSVAEDVYFDGVVVQNTADSLVVDYTHSINGNTLSIDPVNNLDYGASYKATLAAGAVKDMSGNALISQYSFNFTTQAAPDTVPTVVNTDPPDGVTNVPLSKTVSVLFSENIQVGSTFDNIKMVDNKNGSLIVLTKRINGSMLLLDPASDLTKSHSFTVIVPAGAVWDSSGNPLESDCSFTFTAASR